MQKNNDDYLIKAYTEDMKSCNEIAQELSCHPMTISRRLKKLGVETRNRSDAQKLALQTGRSVSPTAGIGHTEETKLKLSESLHEYYEALPPKEKKKVTKRSKMGWESRPVDFEERSTRGNLKAAKNGSALEHYLLDRLIKAGYKVLFHHKGLIDQTLEVDMFLPELNLAIELDGPSHFLPIWGQEALNKTMKADEKKNAQLVNAGVRVLRIKNPNRYMPLWRMNKIAEKLVDTVKNIEYNNVEKNFVEIEVE